MSGNASLKPARYHKDKDKEGTPNKENREGWIRNVC